MRKKNLRLFLLIAFSASLWSCRTEEELNFKNSETKNLQYGISKEAFMGSLFITGLKSSNSKNMASGLTAEDLIERLDLEKAHLNSSNGKEVFHVPVRTFGSYKRSLLSISENGTSHVFLLTYPDPANDRLFYMNNLEGNLLKQVKIGDDGKEISGFTYAGKTPAQEKNGGCEDIVYETCSSGEHSFQWGNAYACTFWHNLGAGSPPKLFRTNGNCPSGGGSPIGTGDGPPGGLPPGGTGTSPIGSGGGPKHQITPANCIQNLDCEECNIPGDTNNDCMLSYAELVAFNTPCEQAKIPVIKTNNILNTPTISTEKAALEHHAANSFTEYGMAIVGTGLSVIAQDPYSNNDPSNPGSVSIIVPTLGDYLANAHTHPEHGAAPPSVKDLYSSLNEAKIYHTFQASFVFAHNGTKYAFVITNIEKIKDFLQAYPIEDNTTDEGRIFNKENQIGRDFNEIYEGYVAGTFPANSGNEQNIGLESAYAYILDKYDAGISIAKTDAAGNLKALKSITFKHTVPYSGGKKVTAIKAEPCP